ncbi:integrase catalytic domain-containing protein [Trichonephila clavata]|uniref:Integrase catalytic domain-containing protein n=1 Tax=Trichonephila clavata TaxID=2740835 RepID=A0A8X6HY75_TRICU|nr:integrase catalytic domain-containing protein [Trichonephila clavata]
MELKQLLQRGGMTLHKWCTNLSLTNAKEFPRQKFRRNPNKDSGHDLEQIASLKKGSSVPQSSKLRFLNPFIDREGLLRVGGRISHSNVCWNQKHPLILPAGNKLVKLIFQYYHKRDFHLGQQALLNTVRLKYWPLGGRSIARRVVHECLECFKNNPVIANQIMGDLKE